MIISQEDHSFKYVAAFLHDSIVPNRNWRVGNAFNLGNSRALVSGTLLTIKRLISEAVGDDLRSAAAGEALLVFVAEADDGERRLLLWQAGKRTAPRYSDCMSVGMTMQRVVPTTDKTWLMGQQAWTSEPPPSGTLPAPQARRVSAVGMHGLVRVYSILVAFVLLRDIRGMRNLPLPH